ncbi:hypothetical protein B9Z55_025451 [Caenorhabditis nigoni]|uniref:F-box domain-containing protein n=2 Tax=Caenorhabditis nigoni TaxID=1611254 RepID=A0A2G5SYG2_9PELO|nr:hypothetical protein B9Z55_025451 [Caenorhabditis nigoni]
MHLLKYPSVVQNEIFNGMEFPDLFMMSFASKNMKKLIKFSSQMQLFKNINTIHYQDYNRGMFVCVPLDFFHDNVIQIAERDDTENDYFQLNVSGKLFDFRISYEHNKYLPVASYQPDERESLVASVHDYFLDFFGNSVEYYWHAYNYKTPIPQLENVSAELHYRPGVDLDALEMARFENFFLLSPVLKSINIDIFNMMEPLNPESKFYQADYMESYQRNPTHPAISRYFQGRQAFIKWWKSDTRDVIEFVNKWKSGEAFQKLEHIKIENYNDEFPQNEILDAIGAQHTDHAKKPSTHSLPKVLRLNHSVSFLWDTQKNDVKFNNSARCSF